MIRDAEVNLLLTDLMDLYGYDFTDYSKASLKRRINRLMLLDKFPSFAEFRFRGQNDEALPETFCRGDHGECYGDVSGSFLLPLIRCEKRY